MEYCPCLMTLSESRCFTLCYAVWLRFTALKFGAASFSIVLDAVVVSGPINLYHDLYIIRSLKLEVCSPFK